VPLSLLPADYSLRNRDSKADESEDGEGENVGTRGLCLLFSEGEATVACNVAPSVIEDLAAYHRLTFSREEIFRIVMPLLDRLASTKYRAGRLEENGEIVIRAADLLRYGFGSVRVHSVRAPL
jgi:hypothetical protein